LISEQDHAKDACKLQSGRCPECGSDRIVFDPNRGERICRECGFVIKNDSLNMEPEWRAFNAQEKEKRSRVGLPLSYAMSDKGLSTAIGNVYTETKRKVSIERKHDLLRMAKWHRRVVNSSKQRNLTTAMTTLDKYCDKLHIPFQVKELAALTYRKSLDKNLIKGRSIDMIVAASIYFACRRTRTQRGLREISEVGNMELNELAKAYRLIITELDLDVPRPIAQNRVPKIASRVNISQRSQRAAIDILREAEKIRITAGKNPTALAAAALYISCIQGDEKCSQKELARAAGVTEVTIRNRYKGIVKALEIIL
jgi:transcription initiation factor TFIIB